MTTDKAVPSRAEVLGYLRDRRNWGRWGDEDQLGALNLITPAKRLAAAAAIKQGVSISMSRPMPTAPGPGNPLPAQHYAYWFDVPWPVDEGSGGVAVDFYGIDYHGYVTTHVDAIGHNWDQDGMWNGRDPLVEVTPHGTNWADVDQMRDGIVTRAVLLDIPALRGTDYVDQDSPVHGYELSEAAAAQAVELLPGDALVVYMGRGTFEVEHPDWAGHHHVNPGLHASCLPYLRDHDVAALAWDFIDASPNEYNVPWTVHGAIYAYGVALIDNCDLEPLVRACRAGKQYEFMIALAPLRVLGGTGSPVNPIAVL